MIRNNIFLAWYANSVKYISLCHLYTCCNVTSNKVIHGTLLGYVMKLYLQACGRSVKWLRHILVYWIEAGSV